MKQERRVYKPIELYLFFIGFIFPLAWFMGSTETSCCCRHTTAISPTTFEEHDGNDVNDFDDNNTSEKMSVQDSWRKRCRIAATLFLTACIVTAVLIMIFKPTTFGLLSSNTSAQTSSASKTATRPGVPVEGSSAWGDAVAGIGVNSA
ncbi:hypothetical protein BCR42DRAFT_387392 [Absidia repens]|uniref:Transmembrane protein n=1 Tax=Absidia repens TaxID=90262 RepID=A0A1X2IZ68_9FUNG|nr:hypothetical protein BCR42DRAFT_387392 [Absidia repens]